MRLAVIMLCVSLLFAARAAFAGGGPAPSEWFGAFSPHEKFTAQVIRDESSWLRLWAELRQTPPHTFNTKRHMALAVFLGMRRTGGYGLVIAPVGVRGGVQLFAVREHTPAAGSMVTQALTTPYRIIVVPARPEPVVFLVGAATGECLYIAAQERARAEAAAHLPSLPPCATEMNKRS